MAKIQKVRSANLLRLGGSKAAAINSSQGRWRNPVNVARLAGRSDEPFTVEFARVADPADSLRVTPALAASLRALGVRT